MRTFALWMFCWGAAPALFAGQGDSLTLDPKEMERMKQAVFGGGVANVAEESPAASAVEESPEQRWCRAMAAAGTEMMPVLLLALLQELNPRADMGRCAADYAAALQLHRLAAAGNAEACTQLAVGLRTGVLPSGLLIMRSGVLADEMTRRALMFQPVQTH